MYVVHVIFAGHIVDVSKGYSRVQTSQDLWNLEAIEFLRKRMLTVVEITIRDHQYEKSKIGNNARRTSPSL